MQMCVEVEVVVEVEANNGEAQPYVLSYFGYQLVY